MKTIKTLDEKIKKMESELQNLREKKDLQILKGINAIIDKRKIPVEYAFQVLENYDFTNFGEEMQQETESKEENEEINSEERIEEDEIDNSREAERSTNYSKGFEGYR